jgi:hypothetical protein
MPPMGWTRNYADDNIATFGFGRSGAFSINGDFQFTQIGYVNVTYNYGMGTVATWVSESDSTTSDSHIHRKIASFDHWDFIDGYRQTPYGSNIDWPKVIQVLANENLVYVLFDNGEVYAAGVNGQGQLGDGTTTNRPYFVRVGRSAGRGTGVLRDEKIIKVASTVMSGDAFVGTTNTGYFLTEDGKVYSTGYNGYGNIGDGTTTNRTTPYLIPQWQFDDKKIIDIWASGFDYPFVVVQTEDDCLYTWGDNDYYNGPGTQDLRIPHRVTYDFKKFGGIKKVYANGESTVNNIFVLTNDGQLHFSGYHYTGQSHTGGKGGNGGNPWSFTFTTMHQLLNERKNSLGRNVQHQLGGLIDISKSIEDFWAIGGRYASLVIKEKKTGLMYIMGHRTYTRPFVHARAATFNEYYSDHPSLTSQNVTLPTPIETGNANDIVQITNVLLPGYAKSLYYLNSDGRAITTNYGSLATRGFGTNSALPIIGFQQNALPFEMWFSHVDPAGPTQFRWKWPISFISQAFPDATNSVGGVAMVTNDDRMVVAHNGNAVQFSQDHGQQGTSTTSHRSWAQRVDF